jgi:hypothetical protein
VIIGTVDFVAIGINKKYFIFFNSGTGHDHQVFVPVRIIGVQQLSVIFIFLSCRGHFHLKLDADLVCLYSGITRLVLDNFNLK